MRTQWTWSQYARLRHVSRGFDRMNSVTLQEQKPLWWMDRRWRKCELSDEEDCFVSDVGSSVDSSLCMPEQEDLRYA